MPDLIKATLIGIVLVVGFFMIPIILAVLVPLTIFGFVVLAAYFFLRVVGYEGGDEDPKKPP